MKRPKASKLTREQFKAICPHRCELQHDYCEFARVRCDIDLPKPCQRMFRFDLLYGDYQRKRPKGSNIPKWNRHKHPDLFPEEAKKYNNENNSK